jgi:hypothetical protein
MQRDIVEGINININNKRTKAQQLLAAKKKFAQARSSKMKVKRPKDSNMKMYSGFWNAQRYQLFQNLIDPWNARDARLPRMINTYSNVAHVRQDFTLQTNALGNLLVYFDSDFVTTATLGTTSFLYNNDVTLTGGTNITTAVNKAGPTASAVFPPGSVCNKYRLVCAAIKATVKLSELNIVGTVQTCYDYGDYDPQVCSATTLATTIFPAVYGNFANVLNGNGGCKQDITGNRGSVYMNWFPVDPLAEVYITPAAQIEDDTATEAGGDPRFVMAFSALSNGAVTTVDFEVVWNIEYLAQPTIKAWLGDGAAGPSKYDHTAIMDIINSGNTSSSLTPANASIVKAAQAYGGLGGSIDKIFDLAMKPKRKEAN